MRSTPLALIAVVSVLALSGCSSSPASSLDLLKDAKAAGISCPDPSGDTDGPGAHSVVCGDLEMTYFDTSKARKTGVMIEAIGAKLGLGDEDTRRFLIGDHFAAFGPEVKLEQLKQKVGGTIYSPSNVEKHV